MEIAFKTNPLMQSDPCQESYDIDTDPTFPIESFSNSELPFQSLPESFDKILAPDLATETKGKDKRLQSKAIDYETTRYPHMSVNVWPQQIQGENNLFRDMVGDDSASVESDEGPEKVFAQAKNEIISHEQQMQSDIDASIEKMNALTTGEVQEVRSRDPGQEDFFVNVHKDSWGWKQKPAPSPTQNHSCDGVSTDSECQNQSQQGVTLSKNEQKKAGLNFNDSNGDNSDFNVAQETCSHRKQKNVPMPAIDGNWGRHDAAIEICGEGENYSYQLGNHHGSCPYSDDLIQSDRLPSHSQQQAGLVVNNIQNRTQNEMQACVKTKSAQDHRPSRPHVVQNQGSQLTQASQGRKSVPPSPHRIFLNRNPHSKDHQKVHALRSERPSQIGNPLHVFRATKNCKYPPYKSRNSARRLENAQFARPANSSFIARGERPPRNHSIRSEKGPVYICQQPTYQSDAPFQYIRAENSAQTPLDRHLAGTRPDCRQSNMASQSGKSATSLEQDCPRKEKETSMTRPARTDQSLPQMRHGALQATTAERNQNYGPNCMASEIQYKVRAQENNVSLDSNWGQDKAKCWLTKRGPAQARRKINKSQNQRKAHGFRNTRPIQSNFGNLSKIGTYQGKTEGEQLNSQWQGTGLSQRTDLSRGKTVPSNAAYSKQSVGYQGLRYVPYGITTSEMQIQHPNQQREQIPNTSPAPTNLDNFDKSEMLQDLRHGSGAHEAPCQYCNQKQWHFRGSSTEDQFQNCPSSVGAELSAAHANSLHSFGNQQSQDVRLARIEERQ